MGAQDTQSEFLRPVGAPTHLRASSSFQAAMPMKAMKAKAMKASQTMTLTAVYQKIADSSGLKRKDVKTTMDTYMDICASELKKTGSFKIGQALKLKLKHKPATPARKGVNPFTKEPCVIKAKPASKKVRALALKQLKDAVN